jgi:YegS/Rv2252/BmrU family lipid kinase
MDSFFRVRQTIYDSQLATRNSPLSKMTSFRKAALIYNPMSGQQQDRRAAQIETVLAVLRDAGVEADAVATRGPGTAGAQALEAVRLGCDAILACGGDGTVHEVLQGLVGSSAMLGVVPLGTANALAADMGLPGAADEIARALLASSSVSIAVGRISYRQHDGSAGSRYFTVAAGIGPDAHLLYGLNTQLKRRWGYVAYMAGALRVWVTHRYPLFEVELSERGARACTTRTARVSQLLAVRINNFGGLLGQLVPEAALRRNDLCLLAFKTRSRLRYLWYVLAVLLGRHPRVPEIELLNATAVECRLPSSDVRIHVEADGEPLGTLPATLEIIPDAVKLLMPKA